MKTWTTPSSPNWSHRPNLSWGNIWRWDWNFKGTRQFNNWKWPKCYRIWHFCKRIITNGLWGKSFQKHWRVSINRSLIPPVTEEKGRGNDCSEKSNSFWINLRQIPIASFLQSLAMTFLVYSLSNSLFNNLSPHSLLLYNNEKNNKNPYEAFCWKKD